MRKYLITLREKRCETQQNVADSLGISRQYYNMIENGERQKRMDMMLISGLANHFNMKVSTIANYEKKYMQSQLQCIETVDR